jgi:hypothetical protein
MEEGYHFLKDTFGVVPHVYWPIDAFGHSAYTPTLMKKYGFDVVFLSRIGSYRKAKMRENKELHFIWEGHPDGESKSQVFAHLI